MTKLIFLFSLIVMMQQDDTIFNFNSKEDLKKWFVVDDGVMGGLSRGTLNIDEEGNLLYSGKVSLENNGGFSSIRHELDFSMEGKKEVVIRLKGDGKKYQCRLKNEKEPYASYSYTFNTSGEWETITLALEDFEPYYRGRRLGIPNFDHNSIQEIGILIGNKKQQDFSLLIDYIKVR